MLPIVSVSRAAAAIANARGGRRGAPPVLNILEVLPRKLFDEVMEDARAALKASGAVEVLVALKSVEWGGRGHDEDGKPANWPCCPSCGTPSGEVAIEPPEATADAHPGRHMKGCVLAAAIVAMEGA